VRPSRSVSAAWAESRLFSWRRPRRLPALFLAITALPAAGLVSAGWLLIRDYGPFAAPGDALAIRSRGRAGSTELPPNFASGGMLQLLSLSTFTPVTWKCFAACSMWRSFV
jgi:hypothetical protein